VTLNQDTVLFCRVRQDDRWSYPAVAKFTLKAPVF
jgi:hypothetical protein